MRSQRPIRDYYKILGLDGSAPQDDIRASYRHLAMKYHPDLTSSQDSGDRMRLINEAFDVLRDPIKRAFYDYVTFADQQVYAQEAGEDIEIEHLLPMSWKGKIRSIFSNLVVNIVGLKGQLDFVLVAMFLLVVASYTLFTLFQQVELAAGLMAVLLVFGAIILMIRIFAELFGRAGIRIEEP